MPLLVKNAIYWIGFEYSNLPIYEMHFWTFYQFWSESRGKSRGKKKKPLTIV